MTEAPSGLVAQPRVEALVVIDDYIALSRAVLRLGQIGRLHQAEVLQPRGAGTDSQQELLEAWRSANELLIQALEQLSVVEAGMAERRRSVIAAVAAADTRC